MWRLFALALALFACGGSAGPADAAACLPAQYPCGPYGFGQGGVIANLTLSGRRDSDHDGALGDDPILPISLADYFADKQYRALAISLAAEWCVPCKNEQPYLKSLFTQYQSDVAFLQVIVQNAAGGPASSAVVDNWSNTYAISFAMAADPDNALNGYYNPSSFPEQMLIDTRDMKITLQHLGAAEPGLKDAIDQLLAR